MQKIPQISVNFTVICVIVSIFLISRLSSNQVEMLPSTSIDAVQSSYVDRTSRNGSPSVKFHWHNPVKGFSHIHKLQKGFGLGKKLPYNITKGEILILASFFYSSPMPLTAFYQISFRFRKKKKAHKKYIIQFKIFLYLVHYNTYQPREVKTPLQTELLHLDRCLGVNPL